jgi:hypothetical protein
MRTRQAGFDDGFMHESFWTLERTSANKFADWLTLTASKFETAQKQNKTKPQRSSLTNCPKANCCPKYSRATQTVIDLRMAEVYQASTTAPVNIAVVK